MPFVDDTPQGWTGARIGPPPGVWLGSDPREPTISLVEVVGSSVGASYVNVDTGGVASRTLTKPTRAQAGDWVFILASGNLAGPPTLDVIPTGFAKMTGGVGVTTQLLDGTNTYLDVLGRYIPDAATAAGISGETWTVTYSGTSKGAYPVVVVRGLDPNNPFDVAPSGTAEAGTPTSHVTGSVTPATAGARLLTTFVDRLTGLLSQTRSADPGIFSADTTGTNAIHQLVTLSAEVPPGVAVTRTVSLDVASGAAVMWVAALRPRSLTPSVAEQGQAPAVGVSTATAVKVAAVAGTTAAAGTSSGARGTAPTAEQGVAVAAATSTATAVRRAVVAGSTTAAASTSGTARKTAPQAGLAPAAGVSTATARHVALRQGTTPAAATSTGVDVRRAVEQGTAAAAGTSSATRAAAGARPQTGVSAAAGAGVASHVRVARPGPLPAAAAASGTGIARHVAVRVGQVLGVGSSTASGRRVVVGRGTAAAAAWSSSTPRRIVVVGTGRAAAAATATALRLVVVETPASMRTASATVARMGAQTPQTGSGARVATVAGARASTAASASSGATAVPAAGPTMTGA